MKIKTTTLNKAHKQFTMASLLSHVITMFVAIILIRYIDDVVKDEKCKDIDPKKRMFLYIYVWILLSLAAVSVVGIIFYLAKHNK